MDELEKLQKLQQWYAAKLEADKVKAVIEHEKVLRAEVAEIFFNGTTVESTHKLALNHGWTLKYIYKLNRKINEPAFPAIKKELTALKVKVDSIFKMKPTLSISGWKALLASNPEAYALVEQAIITTPGSSTLELIAPKVEEPTVVENE